MMTSGRTSVFDYCLLSILLLVLLAQQNNSCNGQRPVPLEENNDENAAVNNPVLREQQRPGDQFKQFEDNAELRSAIVEYLTYEGGEANANLAAANVSQTYGYPMGTWKVGGVRDFSTLFAGFGSSVRFAGDLTGWKTGQVTSMAAMMAASPGLNPALYAWDTAKVRDMAFCFVQSQSFDQDLSNWQTGAVTDIRSTFAGATSFRGWGLEYWNVSGVINATATFQGASSFEQNLCSWGPQMSRNTNSGASVTNNMFQGTACTDTGSPNLMVNPPSPFCVPCGGGNGGGDDTDRNEFNSSSPKTCFESNAELRAAVVEYVTGSAATPSSNLSARYGYPMNAWCVRKVRNMDSIFSNLELPEGDEGDEGDDGSTAAATAVIFNESLTEWDTSEVTSMVQMCLESKNVNPNITTWRTHRVTSMRSMFQGATAFDQDLSSWDVSSVTDMTNQFARAEQFQNGRGGRERSEERSGSGSGGAMGRWDVSSVQLFSGMFQGATSFNEDISDWNTSSAERMTSMFSSAAAFNRDLSSWQVRRVTDLRFMFMDASRFDQSLCPWGLQPLPQDAAVQNMFLNTDCVQQEDPNMTVSANSRRPPGPFCHTCGTCFQSNLELRTAIREYILNENASNKYSNMSMVYGYPMNEWCVSGVRDFSKLFADFGSDMAKGEVFNESLTSWDTSRVTSMFHMFKNSPYLNPDISTWKTGKVTDMSLLFAEASSFRGDLSQWDVSSVVDFTSAFAGAVAFDADISSWNVKSVRTFSGMFQGAKSFDQDLNRWNTGSAERMVRMFAGASAFNQDISDWNVSAVRDALGMFANATSFGQNLCSWGSQLSNTTTVLGMFWKTNCTLTNDPNFTYDPVGPLCEPCSTKCFETREELRNAVAAYITTQKPNPLTAASKTYGYPMNAWCVDRVRDFTEIFAGFYENTLPFTESLSSWNTSAVTSAFQTFRGSTRMNPAGIGAWDMSSVTDTSLMFEGATIFNQNLSAWDVSAVTDMTSMFAGAQSFNGDITQWDVSGVQQFSGCFKGARVFNQDLSKWNTGNATRMSNMFAEAAAFSQNLQDWDVSHVTDATKMFSHAFSYQHNLCSWGPKMMMANDDTVTVGMFALSGCPDKTDPNLTAVPPGPFCTPCANGGQQLVHPAVPGNETTPQQPGRTTWVPFPTLAPAAVDERLSPAPASQESSASAAPISLSSFAIALVLLARVCWCVND